MPVAAGEKAISVTLSAGGSLSWTSLVVSPCVFAVDVAAWLDWPKRDMVVRAQKW